MIGVRDRPSKKEIDQSFSFTIWCSKSHWSVKEANSIPYYVKVYYLEVPGSRKIKANYYVRGLDGLANLLQICPKGTKQDLVSKVRHMVYLGLDILSKDDVSGLERSLTRKRDYSDDNTL